MDFKNRFCLITPWEMGMAHDTHFVIHFNFNNALVKIMPY